MISCKQFMTVYRGRYTGHGVTKIKLYQLLIVAIKPQGSLVYIIVIVIRTESRLGVTVNLGSYYFY